MMHDNHIANMLWKSRRGMLELDLIISKFISHSYNKLDCAQQQLFWEILESTDQDLYQWLLGQVEPPAGKVGDMLLYIKHCYKIAPVACEITI